MSELGAQLHEAQTRLLLSEEAGRQQAAEVVVLQQALGLRGELGLGGGGLGALDGQAQLLQALARVGRQAVAPKRRALTVLNPQGVLRWRSRRSACRRGNQKHPCHTHMLTPSIV